MTHPPRRIAPLALALSLVLLLIAPAVAQVAPQQLRQVADKVKPSLVIAQFTYDSPGQRVEVQSLGVVVRDDGLVMVPLEFVSPGFPDQYLTRFRILIPAEGDTAEKELPAVLAGRDERSGLAFIQYSPEAATQPSTQSTTDEAEEEEEELSDQPPEWVPLDFADERPQVGEPIISVGRLPETSGYHPYVTANRVSAILRGPLPLVLTTGDGLATVGSPAFNEQGQAIGYVIEQEVVSPIQSFINSQQSSLQALNIAPPRLFLPADFLRLSLENPPSADEPVQVPYLGARQLEGLSDDLREYYELGNRAAVQIGDVVADSPAEEAGVNPGDVLIALNGEPLERGDTPEELPEILERTIRRMNVGDEVSLTLLDATRQQREVTATLDERPEQASAARREYFEDLGYTAREIVFDDLYARKLPEDTQGVVIEYIRENSAAASAGLRPGDLIRQLNQTEVTGLEQFSETYTAFRDESPNEAVVMEIIRGGDTQVIRIEPPR